MNAELVKHLVDFIRREKPALRELPIPAYVGRLLAEIDAAGFAVRKKSRNFIPNIDRKVEYVTKVNAWQESILLEPWEKAFPCHDVQGELQKAAQWLRAHAQAGHYKTRLDQFFHNWLSKAKPANRIAAPEAGPTDERAKLIADGINDLAASRSEKLFPTEFNLRINVAARDLVEIPTKHLQECFRRARLLEMRTTPSVFHVQQCWKTLKSELNAAAKSKQAQATSAADEAEEARWQAMTQEERDAETERIRQSLEQTTRKLSAAGSSLR